LRPLAGAALPQFQACASSEQHTDSSPGSEQRRRRLARHITAAVAARLAAPVFPQPRLVADSEDRTPDRTPDRTQDRTLADTFDSDSDDDEDEDGRDDRQRLMRGNPQDDAVPPPPGIQRRVTELPTFNTQTPASGRVYGGGNGGVWANLSAKPTRGEDVEEKPPVRTTRSHPHTPY
jgi:hypothetical protein